MRLIQLEQTQELPELLEVVEDLLADERSLVAFSEGKNCQSYVK